MLPYDRKEARTVILLIASCAQVSKFTVSVTNTLEVDTKSFSRRLSDYSFIAATGYIAKFGNA